MACTLSIGFCPRLLTRSQFHLPLFFPALSQFHKPALQHDLTDLAPLWELVHEMAVMTSVAARGETDSAAPSVVVTLYYDANSEGCFRTRIKTWRGDSYALRQIWGCLLEARAWSRQTLECKQHFHLSPNWRSSGKRRAGYFFFHLTATWLLWLSEN